MDASGAAAIHVAGGVELHAVGRAASLPRGLGPHAPSREAAVGLHVEDADVLARGVVDEEPATVEGETQPVGPVEVVHEERGMLRVLAGAVHALMR